jgi:molybdopterin/thiamine biosynthesis adenylyltransferase
MNPLAHEARYRGDDALRKLAEARLTLCGACAVGSTLAEGLARQGARRLRVVDRDRVEAANLATQIYASDDVGAFKVQALKERLFRAAQVEIDAVQKELTAANAAKLLKDSDVVVDGFDNSAARRAVTEACAAASIPCLHVGLNADFAEIRWNEGYPVPGDPPAGDVCDYPLARNLVVLACAVAAECVIRFVSAGVRENYSVTLKDLRINREEA